jgi:hypothetical protein
MMLRIGKVAERAESEHEAKDGGMTGKNRIMIFGPKDDGSYVVEFRTADGEVLSISIPRNETAVIRHFQARMPHGLFVPDGAVSDVPWPFRLGAPP